MEPIRLTEKQAEYVQKAHERWNFAVGAVRSGKSHLAVTYTIPDRLLQGHGKKGLNVILSSSFGNVERNVIGPMRDFWGTSIVGKYKGGNLIMIAGEPVLCFGAEKRNAVARLRGSEIKFCYIDECCDIHQESFEMLKSRLSLPYSECHAACNPAGPQHYVKQFLDSTEQNGGSLFNQHYTIYDNPFLPEEYVRSLEIEYAGTVYYKRYIEGLWTQAEGLVYPMFDDAFEEQWDGEARKWCVSCDYGTQNAFAALLWAYDGNVWHCVKEYYYSGRTEGYQKTDMDYARDMEYFCDGLGKIDFIVDPSAASFIEQLRRTKAFRVLTADNAVSDGIRETAVCMQTGRIKLSKKCKNLYRELGGYVWQEKAYDDRPVKEEDHACDAMRYFVKTKHIYKPPTQYRSPFAR